MGWFANPSYGKRSQPWALEMLGNWREFDTVHTSNTDSGGDCDQTDIDNIDNWTSGYDVRYDADLNGLIEAADSTRASTFFQGTTMGMGVLTNPDVGKRSPWYKQEQREPCPFLCTYMVRGSDEKQPFRFIYNRSRAIGTNLYLMLYPLTGFAAMLHKHPERGADVHELLGQVTGHELRGEGRVYGGGLNKIEPSELGRVSAVSFVERWPELVGSLRRGEGAGLFG